MQIAKRMRELHSGIELLQGERDAGPFLWQNWDKWCDRCEKVVSYIDLQVLNENARSPAATGLKKRGLLCGIDWPFFRSTVEKYRKWLKEQYGGSERLREQLVFAHNDVGILVFASQMFAPIVADTLYQTQYGNILRMEPPGESPLLLPANKHKQLIVIDFEYANANTVGLEFANHFVCIRETLLPFLLVPLTLMPFNDSLTDDFFT